MNWNQSEKGPNKNGGNDDKQSAQDGSENRFARITGPTESIGDGCGFKKFNPGACEGGYCNMHVHSWWAFKIASQSAGQAAERCRGWHWLGKRGITRFLQDMQLPRRCGWFR